MRRVAITGLGPITAIGIGATELWRRVVEGRTSVSRHSDYIDGQVWETFPVAKVNDFNFDSFGFSRWVHQALSEYELTGHRELYYLLATTKLALDESRLEYNRERNDIAVVLTHENPGVDNYVRQVLRLVMDMKDGQLDLEGLSAKQLAEEMYRRHSRSVYNLQSFMYPFVVSKIFSLHGCTLYLNNACASGLYAIEVASQLIRSGQCDVALVAGADCPLMATKYRWFKEQNLYAEDGLMKPFDRQRNGVVFGEGGAALVLEDYDHARRRGAALYAEYLGGGFTQEAWKIGISNPNSECYRRAFEIALKASGVRPETLAFVNPHGAATRSGDLYEARTIAGVFADCRRPPLVSAFKPYVGHNLGGSALVETAILLLAMRANLAPPTLNYQEPDSALNLALMTELKSVNLQVVAKMSSGFGGFNAVGIFQKSSGTLPDSN
jgi:3-oxoacyl-[acyl-carrier-protein] synthase II